MVNKVILVGFVGRDPDIRTTQAGKKLASFSVATSERWKDRATGERREVTDWHDVVVFNEHIVEFIEKYVRKGARVFVEGSQKTRKFTDKDGFDRWKTETVIGPFRGSVQTLDKSEQSESRRPPDDMSSYGSESRKEGGSEGSFHDDEIPF